ncbi:MAP kinase-activating death domain protein-like [Clytia hemisphaerica]|uniref:MAP kinase-activating death domain protein n=1 Tax=Clytia hemisphaerica TaxID=252671 RepID=A0A7M5V2R3_9CNID
MARLVEYVAVVGLKRPTVDSTQSPELLRKYPETDHKDFPLPPDVIFFCQPEGCATASKPFSIRQMNSFVFTLTDKETGITRYGICCNFFRPCLGDIPKNKNRLDKRLSTSSNGSASSVDDSASNPDTGVVRRTNSKKRLCRTHSTPVNPERAQKNLHKNSVLCYSLTSVCIISSYPFFSTFRECLFVFRKLVDSRCAQKNLGPLWSKESFAFFDSNQNIGQSLPLLECRNWSLFCDNSLLNSQQLKSELLEIDDWIRNFLKIPLPIAGVNRVEVELLPRHIQPPLTFALPEKSRFSFLDFPIHLPLELLGIETCLKILTCIMLEHKVVLQSSDYNALSISVMALTSMLYPLEYMFPIIPLLPTCMKNAEQLLLAPTPYVIGIPSSFFALKTNFEVPTDVLIVDLDTNKMSVPLQMDEIPNLPEPEGTTLRNQLRKCLSHMSLSSPPVDLYNNKPPAPTSRLQTEHPDDDKSSQSLYGNDMDSVDIAVRSALVKFFCSPNILSNFTKHTRVLRLYPRPVVAFLKDVFISSRSEESSYIRALVDTQAVEFFAEYMVNPDNTVFRKVQNGILDPRIIGDKPKWYSHYVQPLFFQVHNPHSRLGCDLYEDSDDSESDSGQIPSTIEEEGSMLEDDEDGNDDNVHDCDNCSCCTTSDDTDDTSDDEIFDQAHDSASMFDCSYSGTPHPEIGLPNSVITMPAYRSEEDVSNSAPQSRKASLNSKDSGGGASIDSTPTDSPSSERAPVKLRNFFGSIRPKLQSRLSIDSNSSVVSMTSMQSFNTDLSSPQTHLYKAQSISAIQKSPLDRTIMEGFESLRGASQSVYNSENQQMITEVVGYVKNGDGIGWLSQKKLRKILNHEQLRQYLINQMDIDRRYSANTLLDIHISRGVYRGYMELLKLIIEGYEYSTQWKGLAGLASVFDFLEVTHRYFCGKRYKDDGTMENSEELASPIVGEKAVVNGKGERTHRLQGAANEVNSTDSLHFHRDEDLIEVPEMHHSSSSTPKAKKSPDLRKKTLLNDMKEMKVQDQNLYLVCKSNSSGKKRFYKNELHETVLESAGKGVTGTGRRYLYEGIVRNRSTMWDNLDFWEQSFLDAVAVEREAAGLDLNPSELIARYKALSPKERKILEEDEDELLGILLHNMIGYMVCMGVTEKNIKFKVRRLLAKAHIGIAQSQRVDKLLSNLTGVTGNDIDLLVPRSKRIKIQNFVVHLGDTQSGLMFFLEVREDCLVLKSTQGNVIERWWYENVVNLSCSPKTKVLCVWIRTGEETDLQKICTKKCKALYDSIKDSMKKAAERLNKEGAGINLVNDYKVVDTISGDQGILKVSLEGVSVVFVERKLCVDVKQLKNCCAKQHTLIVEEYVPHNQSVVKHQFFSEEANEICYAILCLFSYIAAAKNTSHSSSGGTISSGHNSDQ